MVNLFSTSEDGLVDAAAAARGRGAAFGLIAGAVLGEAVGQDHRAINGADYFESGDTARIAREAVAAESAGDRFEDALTGEGLQNLCQKRD